MVFADIIFFFDVSFKLSSVHVKKPSENGFLDLLVIFLLEELILEKLHRAENEKLAIFRTDIKCTNWAVRRKADRTTRKNRLSGFSHINCASVRIDELQTSVLISVRQFVSVVLVALSIFTLLLLLTLGFSIRHSHQLFVQDSVPNKCFLGVEVLIETLPNNRVSVDADSNLFEHGVNIGGKFVFSAFCHNDEDTASILNVEADVLEFLGSEREFGRSQEEHMALLQAFIGESSFVNFAL